MTFPRSINVLALSAALAVMCVASATLAPAAAAAAAETPTGETLYGISCSFASNEHGLEVLAIHGSTGEGVALGDSGHPVYYCGMAASWDRVDESCSVYTIARGGDEPSALLRTNLATGVSSLVAPLTIDGQMHFLGSFTIDGAGAAWATWNNTVYSVDLTTGVLTVASSLDVGGLGYLTWSPADNGFYAHANSTVYRVDVLTGHASLVGSVVLPGGEPVIIEGMTIDSVGTFWISRLVPADYEEPSEWVRELISASPTLSGVEVAGRFSTVDAEVPVVALLSVPAQAACDFELPTLALPEPSAPPTPAALAATGAGDPLRLVSFAAITVAIGGALLVMARLRARRR